MAVTNSKTGRIGLFFANPMIAKLDKVEETDNNSVSLKGIASKTFILLVLTLVGIGLYFILDKYIPVKMLEADGYSMNIIQGCIVLILILIAAINAFLSFKLVKAAAFLGSVYSLIQGYSLAFVFEIFGQDILVPAIMALIITILTILLMLFLYKKNIIKVTHRFSSVVITLFIASILLGIIYVIISAIPACASFVKMINDNEVIYILVALGSLIISILFLLIDFEVINNCIEKKLPKKYEWLGAFGLAFSVIEVYMRILDLLNAFNSDIKN